MIPRNDVVSVHAQASVEDLERLSARSGRSRLPVHEGDLDRYVGVLHVKDLLGIDEGARQSVRAADLARPAMAAPESRGLEDLMLDMRAQRQHVALVVDEHGSVVGLVTLEDVIEELIGDFEDESDRRQVASRRADGAVLVPGTLRPDELGAMLAVDLPEGEWETLAGLVMAALERVPVTGDVVETAELRLEVTRMEGHRVREIAVLAS